MAPSLRRSTIERTALSKKLAEEAGETNPKKSSLRVPGVRVTETSASLKTKIGNFVCSNRFLDDYFHIDRFWPNIFQNLISNCKTSCFGKNYFIQLFRISASDIVFVYIFSCKV